MRDNQLKSGETISALRKLLDEWKIFAYGLFCPFVIIPLGLTIIALWVANIPNVDKDVSLILQIIATLFAAIAAGFFYDVIKNITGSNILVKKGLSAVRNLSLTRLKTKNISDRAKGGASVEEVKNLLSLLEKDIANATQEWNDILPGVGKTEEVYSLLAEKESDLELNKKEKEQLNKQLIEEKQLSEKDKEALKKKLDEKEKKILELSHEITKLCSTASSSPFISLLGNTKDTGGLGLLGKSSELLGSKDVSEKQCSKCGKTYQPLSLLLDVGLCESCRTTFKK